MNKIILFILSCLIHNNMIANVALKQFGASKESFNGMFIQDPCPMYYWLKEFKDTLKKEDLHWVYCNARSAHHNLSLKICEAFAKSTLLGITAPLSFIAWMSRERRNENDQLQFALFATASYATYTLAQLYIKTRTIRRQRKYLGKIMQLLASQIENPSEQLLID